MQAEDDEKLVEIVDEFLESARVGDSPSLDAYCEKYPDYADQLRELVPALGMLEELQPSGTDGQSSEPENLPDEIGDYLSLIHI